MNPVLKRMLEYLTIRDIALTKADKMMRSGNGRFGKMSKYDTVPKGAFIEKFLQTFPEVNKDWLEEETGGMLNISKEGDVVFNNTPKNKDTSINDDLKGIPMYNAPGAGGGVEIYTDPNSNKIIGYLNFPGITKGSYALPVYGHSMSPTLEDGSWVVLRPIEDKLSIAWGQIYYIEYGDYRLFKRLLIGDSDDDVVLWSDNQTEKVNNKPIHSPIYIKKTDIRSLCLVTDIYKKSNN